MNIFKEIKKQFFSNFLWVLVVFGLLGAALAFAQTLPNPPDLGVQPTPEEIHGWLETWKGNLGALAIAFGIAQGGILAMRWSGWLQEKTGRFKWIITTGLHLLSCVLVFLIAGKGWEEISINPVILATFGNWIHQLITQVFTKKGDA